MTNPVSPSAMQYQHLAESAQERAAQWLNCEADLHEGDVINLVAAMHDEIARLRADLDEQCRINGMGSEREAALMARLAESQAREKVRLDALAAVVARMRETPAVQGDEFKDLGMQARHAMNLPADDTALRERLAKERERCASVCETRHANGNWKHDTRHECAEAIRAIGDEA